MDVAETNSVCFGPCSRMKHIHSTGNVGEWQKIRGPFLESVKMTLGDRYTDNIEAIYQVTVNLIIETLIEGYEAGMKKQQGQSASSQEPS